MWLVKFYAPWCGHCKKLDPIYKEVARELQTANSGVKVAKLDCTRYSQIASELSVKGFPTIMFINGDKVYTHRGDRTKEDILEFVLKAQGPTLRRLSSVGKFNEALGHHSGSVFFLYIGDDDEHNDLYRKYHNSAENHAIQSYFYFGKKHILEDKSVKRHPTILVFKDNQYFEYDRDTTNGLSRRHYQRLSRRHYQRLSRRHYQRFEQETLPTFEQETLPTFEQETLPTFEQETLPTFEQETLPTTEVADPNSLTDSAPGGIATADSVERWINREGYPAFPKMSGPGLNEMASVTKYLAILAVEQDALNDPSTLSSRFDWDTHRMVAHPMGCQLGTPIVWCRIQWDVSLGHPSYGGASMGMSAWDTHRMVAHPMGCQLSRVLLRPMFERDGVISSYSRPLTANKTVL
ncbi:Protein disulfide-isomerase tmx3 [Bulinus truncatus]|nr:Protein disulfide-isomerase tmx3 [Bulinus truncatus]